MASVSSISPGLADVLQTLSTSGPSVLSSSSVASALESAPVADIVQLSNAASQLTMVDGIFGLANGSSDSLNASLEALLASAGSSPSSQLAAYQTASQDEQTEDLLDAAAPSGTTVDTTG